MQKKTNVKDYWFIYFIRDKNSHLYCGITSDLEKRLAVHKKGKGAKYLRGKTPLELVWFSGVNSKSDALKIEYRLKQLSKKQKESIIVKRAWQIEMLSHWICLP